MSDISMRKKNKGVTMVELIVTFALLAIFLGVASMCISHAIIHFFNERQTMAAYSVADMVLSEVKDEIRTMQASKKNGYVKVRSKDGEGKLVAASKSDDSYTGCTLEYITSDINDNANAVQIDTRGCSDVLINEDGKNDDYWEDLEPGYLTMRYYSRYPEKDIPGYKNLFMDVMVDGTTAVKSGKYDTLAIGQRVVWHAQEKLSKPVYQGFTVSLEFAVTPEENDEGKPVVKYVDVTANVNDVNGLVYKKARRVSLQNVVFYTGKKTMYSDGAETAAAPETVSYTVEYYDTKGNSIRPAATFQGKEGDVVSGTALQVPIAGYSYIRSEGGGTLTAGVEKTVKLFYEANSFTITYVVDGSHIVNNDNPSTYRYGEELGTIKIPAMEKGYAFNGWFLDAAHTSHISQFSEAEGYDQGNITLYGYEEAINSTVEGNIDGMENDDREHKFSDLMDPPDVLTNKYAYDGNNIVYAIHGYNDNYHKIKANIEAAIGPHSYTLDDVLVSTEIQTGDDNKRRTKMFLLEKTAIKALNINAQSTGEQIVEAFLKYANREDVSKVETITIEIPPDAVAVYESEHDWNDSSKADTKWVKMNPEPVVYLHMTVDRQLVTWENVPHYWRYYNYTIWMTTSP